MRIVTSLYIAVLLLVAGQAVAQDRPTLGFVFNKSSSDALQYDCSIDRGDLKCDFIQMRVHPKVSAEEAQKRLEKALGEFGMNADSNPDKKTCDQFSSLAIALRTGKVPRDAELQKYLSEASKMVPEAKARALRMFEIYSDFCNDKSKRSYATLLNYMMERDERTCVVSAFPYSQRFKYFPETGNWVVRQDGPQGPCGFVNVSRFEPDKSTSGITFWNYHAQKVVTNKGGQSVLPCSGFDEGSYEYQWQSRPIPMTCETIEFGAL